MFKLRKMTRGWVFVGLAACAVFLAGANPEVGYARPLLLGTSPTLGAATTFAVLGATAVINTPISAIKGNVGLSPAAGTNYAGLTVAQVTGGTIYAVDATGPAGAAGNNPTLVGNAQAGNLAAFGALNQGCDHDYGAVTQDLAGLTLVPGVYCANVFQLTTGAALTLDDTGAPNGVWIFIARAAAAALTTTPGVSAKVQFLHGIASPCNVWWRVASSATIGGGTAFIGNILALTSISLGTGASLSGRALVQTGAVTMDTNAIDMTMCLGVATGVSLSKSFKPATIPAGGVSVLTITFSNTSGTAATLTSSFTDNLPGGIVIAATPNVATTCGGAPVLTAVPGGSAVTMGAGGIIPGGGSCTLTVNVSTPGGGTFVNTVPSSALVTTNGNSTTKAIGTLNSNAAPAAAPAAQPKEVPESDTLLLFGGGIGGLATWLGWQWRKVRARSKQ